jgi:hypothetical protein
MPKRRRCRCRTCGERFELDVLTEEEMRENRRKNGPGSPIACPKCRRRDLQEGWH